MAAALGLGSGALDLDAGVEARGYRLLHRLPRLSDTIIERIVERFVDPAPRSCRPPRATSRRSAGWAEARARSVKDGLARLVEASILERYE